MKQYLLLPFLVFAASALAQYNPFVNLNGVDELQHPEEVFIIDFDLDGDNDIVCLTDREVGWFENLGFNFYSEMQYLVYGKNDLEILDVDEDGDLDLVFITTGFSHVYVAYNLGDEVFSEPEVVNGGAGMFKMEFTDFDLDGDLDMIGVQSTRVEWMEYNEFNDLVAVHTIMDCLDAYRVTDLHVVDMDGDADDDIIWCSDLDTGNFYYIENFGDGTFAEPDTIDSEITMMSNITIADFDEDGDLDLVTGSSILEFGSYNSFIHFYENLGDSFAAGILITDNLRGKCSVFSADLDLDGQLDVLSTSSSDNKLAFYKGHGDNTFESQLVITTSLDEPKGIAVGDLNDDGDNDISIASHTRNIGYLSNTRIHSNYFEGQLFIDFNENGIHDLGEVGLPTARIRSTPRETMAVTGRDGRFGVSVDGLPNGEYEIFPFLPDWHITSDNLTHTLTVSDTTDFLDTLDFGLIPDVRFDSVSFDLTGFSRVRCIDTNVCWIAISNLGTTSPSGKLHLVLDDSLTFVSAELEPDSVIGQNVFWSYNDLDYLEIKSIYFLVIAPDGVGDTVVNNLYASVQEDLEITYETDVSHEQVVICSYDPNDKTPNPLGEGDFGNIPMNTESIEYTIRFQNTGTDTAHLIIIRDELDENLNWTSFEPITSSHDMRVNYNPDGEISFIFENIMLPDSFANPIESQGFVKYRIKVKPDLLVGTTFENTAGIYFDHNPVVLTNTTINTLYEKPIDLSLAELMEDRRVLVYPNPTKGTTTVLFDNELFQSDQLIIVVYDIIGKEVYKSRNIIGNKHLINTQNFDKGVYLITIKDFHQNENTIHTTKLIVE